MDLLAQTECFGKDVTLQEVLSTYRAICDQHSRTRAERYETMAQTAETTKGKPMPWAWNIWFNPAIAPREWLA